MEILKDKKSRLLLTPQLAEKWLEQFRYVEQRPIKSSRVQEYENLIRQGKFHAVSEITFAIVEGVKVMLNGYHRCEAVVHAETPIKVWVHDVYLANWRDVSELYATFDPARSGRSLMEVIPSELAARNALTKAQMARVASAGNLVLGGFRRSCWSAKRSNWELIEFAERYAPEAEIIYNSISGCSQGTRKAVLVTPALSLWLVMARADPERVAEMLGRIALNDSLVPGSPLHTMKRVLDEEFEWTKDLKFPMKLAVCWNRFLADQQIQRVRLATDEKGRPKPVPVERTQYVIGA
jgi:hypothetical protein